MCVCERERELKKGSESVRERELKKGSESVRERELKIKERE